MNKCINDHNLFLEQKNSINLQNNQRILLIDNNDDVLLTFKLLLQNCGFIVDTFTNPVEALYQFNKNPMNYNIVISDTNIPYVSEFEFIKKVRLMNPEIIVIVSTDEYENFINQGKMMLNESSFVEIDGIIHKPISQYKLCKIVNETLVQ
ncbi:MAG: response regulator [Nitrososphaeraceae archaeon]